MTDAELLAEKLTKIGTCLREIRTLTDLDRLRKDVKEERFVARTLQLTVQAALDAASHIVSDDRLGEPETNEELFTLLGRNGWITPSLATELRSMARLRNLLVYDYARIDLEEVEEVVRSATCSRSPEFHNDPDRIRLPRQGRHLPGDRNRQAGGCEARREAPENRDPESPGALRSCGGGGVGWIGGTLAHELC